MNVESVESGFPGHGPDAPLDLSGLSPAAEAAVVGRLIDGTSEAWSETLAAVKNCARPVRLVGGSRTFRRGDTSSPTGEVSDLRAAMYRRYGPGQVELPDHVAAYSSEDAPLGVLYRACGNRRADVCPACSRVYARDTYAMIRAGLTGGKTIPASVADNPLLFATLTAPSFGLVHTHHKTGARCRPRARDKGRRCAHGRPISCMKIHTEDDRMTGSAFCEDCYDWTGAVVWQWWAPELWRRTTIALRRALAARLGVAESKLGTVASVQFVKVAEYQARGLVHFHALVRLDGPDGPGSPAPLGGHELADLLGTSADWLTFDAPPIDRSGEVWPLEWGDQLDIRVVRDAHRIDDPTDDLRPEQVAGYLAKYATKDANSVRVDEPRPHLARLSAACFDLAEQTTQLYSLMGDENPYGLIRKWAHMLGFRGHFSTKSRAYSVTLGRLRRARARYQALVTAAKTYEEARAALHDVRELEALLLADEDETTLVIGEWTYQGTGWTQPGDEALALAAAARAREYDQWKAAQTSKASA